MLCSRFEPPAINTPFSSLVCWDAYFTNLYAVDSYSSKSYVYVFLECLFNIIGLFSSNYYPFFVSLIDLSPSVK